MDGNERGRPVALEQRHAAAAAGDQQVARVETLEQLAPRLVDLALVVGRPAGQVLQLGLVRRRRRHAGEAQETIAAVDRHHRAGAPRDRADAIEDARGDGAVAVVGDEDGVGAGGQRRQARQQRVLRDRLRLVRRLAIEADDLLSRGLVAAGHDARLHRCRAAAFGDDAVGRDPRRAEERQQLLAGAVPSDRADRRHARAERVGVVRRVRRAAEEDLALGESQDEHRRLTRDPDRLAEEILVEDQIADDDHAPTGEAVDRPAHGLPRPVHRVSPLIAQSAAPRRSSAT